jgi:hypothetical protein
MFLHDPDLSEEERLKARVKELEDIHERMVTNCTQLADALALEDEADELNPERPLLMVALKSFWDAMDGRVELASAHGDELRKTLDELMGKRTVRDVS